MIPIRFQGEVWKQGNSLLVTIPKGIREAYALKEKDLLDIQARIIDKKVLEEMKELNRLSSTYQYRASGEIWHEKEKIGVLEKVFVSEMEFRAGALGPGQSFDALPIVKSVAGIIYRGHFLPNVFEKKHFGKYKLDSVVGKYLPVELKLTLENGEKKTLEDLIFEPGISTEKGLLIKKVEFHASPRS